MENEKSPRPDRSRRRRKPSPGRTPSAERADRSGPSPSSKPSPSNRRIHWQRHALEFFVIVAGIMVSFLLNDWRQERQDRRDEQRLLNDLLVDLRQDSLNLANEIAETMGILSRLERLARHAEQPIPQDSIPGILGPTLSYSRIPFQQVTYHAMRATGGMALIRDQDLLRDLLLLYEQQYFMLQELSDLDKRYALERIFPYVDSRIVVFQGDSEALDRMAQETEWKNLLFISNFFKGENLAIMRRQGEMVNGLMRRIEQGITP